MGAREVMAGRGVKGAGTRERASGLMPLAVIPFLWTIPPQPHPHPCPLPPKLLVSQKEILSKPNLHPSSLNRAPSVVGNQQELPLSSFPPSCLVLLMLFFHGTVAKPGASLELW